MKTLKDYIKTDIKNIKPEELINVIEKALIEMIRRSNVEISRQDVDRGYCNYIDRYYYLENHDYKDRRAQLFSIRINKKDSKCSTLTFYDIDNKLYELENERESYYNNNLITTIEKDSRKTTVTNFFNNLDQHIKILLNALEIEKVCDLSKVEPKQTETCFKRDRKKQFDCSLQPLKGKIKLYEDLIEKKLSLKKTSKHKTINKSYHLKGFENIKFLTVIKTYDYKNNLIFGMIVCDGETVIYNRSVEGLIINSDKKNNVKLHPFDISNIVKVLKNKLENYLD